MVRSVIRGVGSALPKRVMTNDDMSKVVDTSHEWIVERTGIHARHIAGEGETTRTLAVAAARDALEAAGLEAERSTSSSLPPPRRTRHSPQLRTSVQADLGIRQGMAFDVQAVCSGFV